MFRAFSYFKFPRIFAALVSVYPQAVLTRSTFARRRRRRYDVGRFFFRVVTRAWLVLLDVGAQIRDEQCVDDFRSR